MIIYNPSGAPELACEECGCRWFDRMTNTCYECGQEVSAEQQGEYQKAYDHYFKTTKAEEEIIGG